MKTQRCEKLTGIMETWSRSQQILVTEKIINTLDLKPVRSVNMGISGFLSNKEGEMSLKEYELKITSMDGKYTDLINVLGIPKICPNIQGQNFSCVIQNHELLITAKERQTVISL